MSAELAVLVVDETGVKLESALVTLVIVGLPRTPVIEKTNTWGLATFRNLGAGTYLLSSSVSNHGVATRFVTVQDNTSQQITVTLYPIRHIYFAIYYKVKDGAFRRAAETWAREIRGRKDYDRRNDKLLLMEQLSEGEFKSAGNLVYQQGKLPGG